jgi:hypothetical protein
MPMTMTGKLKTEMDGIGVPRSMFTRIRHTTTFAIAIALSSSNLSTFAADIKTIPNQNGPPIISIKGEFKFGDEKAFVEKALTLSDAIVEFDSPGGSLATGIEIGRAIRLKGFSTSVHANAICASACGFAWLGGTRREIQTEGAVGFHAAYTLESGTAKETGIGNAVLGSYLNQLGLSQRAIEYATIASPTSMTWLTKQDGEALGIEYSVVAAREQDTAESIEFETATQMDATVEVVDIPRPDTVVRVTPDIGGLTEFFETESKPWNSDFFGSHSGLDILGCDLGEVQQDASIDECAAKCKVTPECKAFTYQLSKKSCYLKTCAVWAVSNDDFISGLNWIADAAVTRLNFSVKYGFDIRGSDYDTVQSPALVDCVRSCRDESECKAFSYVPKNKQCWLKTGVAAPTKAVGVVSGEKQ